MQEITAVTLQPPWDQDFSFFFFFFLEGKSKQDIKMFKV